MSWKKEFFSAMESMDKTALLGALGTIAVGAMTASDVKNQAEEMKRNVQLNPLQRDTQFKLKRPSSFQFEGGKHSPLKQTQTPHFSLYD